MVDKSVEAVKDIIKRFDKNNPSPLLDVIDIIADIQHKEHPGEEVFDGMCLRSVTKCTNVASVKRSHNQTKKHSE